MTQPLLDALDAPLAQALHEAWAARTGARLAGGDCPLQGDTRLAVAEEPALPLQPALHLHWRALPAVRAWIDNPQQLRSDALLPADPVWRNALVLQALEPFLAWWAGVVGSDPGLPRLEPATATNSRPWLRVPLALHQGDAEARIGLEVLGVDAADPLADALADALCDRGNDDDDDDDRQGTTEAPALPQAELRVLLDEVPLTAGDAQALAAGAGVLLAPPAMHAPLLLRGRAGWLVVGDAAPGPDGGWQLQALHAPLHRLHVQLPTLQDTPSPLRVLSAPMPLAAAQLATLREGDLLPAPEGTLVVVEHGGHRGTGVLQQRGAARVVQLLEWPC